MIYVPDGCRSRVRTGREVAYEIYGDPSGDTVFYLHGFPSSRLEAALHNDAAAAVGVRLVAIDRPGYGGSQAALLSIGEVGRDVIDVADALAATDFGLVGVSGGAPYAVACASLASDRVRALALMAPLGPPESPRYGMRLANRSLLALAAKHPSLFSGLQRLAAGIVRRRAQWVVTLLSRTLPERERKLVDDPTLRRAFAAVLSVSFDQRGAGARDDGLRLTRPWGIDCSSVLSPTRIWHGLLDDIVPPAMGGYLRSRIGGATELTILEDEGHFSLVRNHIQNVLKWIKAASPAA